MRSRKLIMLQLGIAMVIPIMICYLLEREMSAAVTFHNSLIYAIGLETLFAVLIFLIMGIVAYQLRNFKILYVSLSYLTIGTMLAFHGYSFMHDEGLNERQYMYAQLALLLASFWLWQSSLSGDHRLVRLLGKHRKALLPVWCLMLTLGGVLDNLLLGEFILQVLLSDTGAKLITVSILAVNTWTVYRHLITYMASRFSIQLAIVYNTGWINTAQVILFTMTKHVMGWWMYHSLMLLSMIVMLLVIIFEYRHNNSLTALARRLHRVSPDRWIQTYMTQSVRELVRKTETKDAYTAGHNYRVTVYALKLGEEMGLSSTQLKSIALGGLVHDVGKLYVPDYVLNKPGKLSTEERKLIENHPVDGYNMCKQIGFMLEELAIIRSHHEKWNGTGYPDQLAGEEIPLVARVIAVADVYDALTSSRSYRKAMSHEEAMNIIHNESGLHFDPRCVEAWCRVVHEEKEFFNEMLSNRHDIKSAIG